MAGNRLRPLNVRLFTGGINLRTDAFDLAENEVQLCLNVELDPRGGFYARKGWQRWNSADINTTLAPTWNPRAMHAQTLGGTEVVFVANAASYAGGGANKGSVLYSTAGTFVLLLVGSNPLVADATPHIADFAPWKDLVYIACGSGEQAAKWAGPGGGSIATLLTASAAANFVDDYTAPSGACFPKCELATPHLDRMVVAYTNEDSTAHPNRVRFSHPNNAENWASTDYIDISAGGEKITALLSFGDHLLVFKTNSVWAIHGYDAESFQMVQVTEKVGALHRQAVAKAENSVYFLSWPHGVYEYDGDGVFEVSEQLRPGIRSPNFNSEALESIWLNYVDQRLWVAVPFSTTATPSDAATNLILDRSLSSRGSWMAYRGADDAALGPMVEAVQSDVVYGACRATRSVARVEQLDDPKDNLNGTETPFSTYLITRWFDAGWPTLKKSWKRPEFLLQDSNERVDLRVDAYRDYNEASPHRSLIVTIPESLGGAKYDDGSTYDSGIRYGGTAEGSKLVRGSSFGLARSIRLRFIGPPGVRWGVDAFVLKHLNKRFK